MIRNILWDVDGTLFDTYPAITYALSKALNEMGLSVALNVIDSLARESLSHCVETLAQRFKLDPDLLRARFAESYRMVDPANQPPYPGVYEVCEWIRAHGGVNVIVTHRDVQSKQRLLDIHELSPLFSDIFSVDQGYSRKPGPSMLLAALESHRLDADETLMVGDRDLDIQAGQAAGVRTCLFGNAQRNIPADIRISDYNQLLDILAAEQIKALMDERG
ncbi:MAG: HAD-IA family hydrolase [Anaerolineales bacterium]